MAVKVIARRLSTALLLSALFCLGGLNGTEAGVNEWTTNGPWGASIHALAIDPLTPTIVYAGIFARGVFKSTDGGGTWSLGNAGLSDRFVVDLAIDPQTPTSLYASTSGGGVFKSTDGGGTWSARNTGLTDLHVLAVAIDPQTPTTLYAGTAFGGVFKSTDGGGTWSAVNTGLTNQSGRPFSVLTLAIDPNTPTTLFAGTAVGGVLKSLDGGGMWSAVNTGLPFTFIGSTDYHAVRDLAIDPLTPTTLYAGIDRGVFKSTDGGGTWSPVNIGLTDLSVNAVAIDPLTPATVYAGTTFGGVFKSTDGGGTWSAVNTGLTHLSVNAVAIDPLTPATVYAGTELGAESTVDNESDGVFKSTDGGGSWSAANAGLSDRFVLALAIDPRSPTILYASAWERGVYKSTGGGSSWSTANAGMDAYYSRLIPDLSLAIDPLTPTTLYRGTRDGVFKSTDGGGHWSAVVGLSDVVSLAIDPLTPTTLYAGIDWGVFKSIDGGSTWIPARAGLDASHVWALAIDPLIPTTLYAGTTLGGVFKSVNGGGTWSAVNTGLTNTFVLALAIDPRTPTTLYAGTNGGGVFKSTDGGGTWSAVNTGLSVLDVRALAIDPQTPTSLYVGIWGGGVFNSVNGGGTWTALNTGLTDLHVRALAIDPDTPTIIYAGTLIGVFAIEQRDTTPPTVALTSPSDGATVSGTITVKAIASDDLGVAGVQFLLDGVPLGAEDTAAPYEVAWDTRTVPDGSHTLTARARDAAGNTATSVPVRVTVANGLIPTLTLARSEESAATLAGGWFETTSGSTGVALSGDRAVASAAAGATATFTFTGTGMRWIGVPCEVCGIANVLIDGARVATVDTFAPTRPAASTAVYTSPRLALGSHTVVIEVTGAANTASGGAFVVVDAFDVTLDGAGLLAPSASVP